MSIYIYTRSIQMVDPATFLEASKLPRRVLRASEDPRYLGNNSHGMTIRIVIFRLEKQTVVMLEAPKNRCWDFLKCKLVLVE